jgi:hypothetical protein
MFWQAFKTVCAFWTATVFCAIAGALLWGMITGAIEWLRTKL